GPGETYHRPALSPRMVQVLQTALAKAPDERFQSAQALGRAVQQALTDGPAPSALSTPSWSQPSNPAIPSGGAAPVAPPAPAHFTGPYEPGTVSNPSFSSRSYETRVSTHY